MDFRVAPAIAEAVALAAIETGQARKVVSPELIRDRTLHYVYEGRWPLPPETTGPGATLGEQSLDLHARHRGILQIKPKIPIRDVTVLKGFYVSPGLAGPVEEIARDPMKVYDYTAKGNLVAVSRRSACRLAISVTGGVARVEGRRSCLNLCRHEASQYAGDAVRMDCRVIKHISPTFGGITGRHRLTALFE